MKNVDTVSPMKNVDTVPPPKFFGFDSPLGENENEIFVSENVGINVLRGEMCGSEGGKYGEK